MEQNPPPLPSPPASLHAQFASASVHLQSAAAVPARAALDQQWTRARQPGSGASITRQTHLTLLHFRCELGLKLRDIPCRHDDPPPLLPAPRAYTLCAALGRSCANTASSSAQCARNTGCRTAGGMRTRRLWHPEIPPGNALQNRTFSPESALRSRYYVYSIVGNYGGLMAEPGFARFCRARVEVAYSA